MNKRLLKKFCRYGWNNGMIYGENGWIATAYAIIRAEAPSGVLVVPFNKLASKDDLEVMIALATKSRTRVTIDPVAGFVAREIVGYRVTGLKPTGRFRDAARWMVPVLYEVINAQKPDKLVSVKSGKHERAVATVKDGACIGIFMPMRSVLKAR